MKRFLTLTFAAALLITGISAAHAGERERSFGLKNANGRTATAQRAVERDGEGRKVVRRSAQGENGATATSVTERRIDREAGTLSRETTGTGPGGRSWSSDRTVTKTDDGISISGGSRGEEGKGYQVERNVVRNEDGSYSTTATYTGAGGKTYTTQGNVVKTEDGYRRTGTVTNGDGVSRDYQAAGTRTEDGYRRTQNWTGLNGEQRQRAVTSQIGEDGYTKTIESPAGTTRSWTGSMNE